MTNVEGEKTRERHSTARRYVLAVLRANPRLVPLLQIASSCSKPRLSNRRSR